MTRARKPMLDASLAPGRTMIIYSSHPNRAGAWDMTWNPVRLGKSQTDSLYVECSRSEHSVFVFRPDVSAF